MKTPFRRLGVMVDLSRNAVMTPASLISFGKEIASMGYNALLLYTEDTYELEGEAYFGHHRGRYSKEDLKKIVSEMEKVGIEVIPCIQTLAHLDGMFRWKKYTKSYLWDLDNVLLAESEESYALIRKMLRTVKEVYKTSEVHIGMDEAHSLGLGNYLKKNGYQDRFGILSRHLQKVCEMAREEGLSPNIWSDMFFRLGNGGVYSSDHPHIDPEEIGALPEGLNLTYWDYYSTGKRRYRAMFRAHKKLTDRIWFAGGIWTWKGFCPDNRHSVNTCIPGLQVAMEEGVENVMVTLWGDNGGECSRFSALPALFTVASFARGERDKRKIEKEFFARYGIPYRSFLHLDMKMEKKKPTNPEKYLLYQDPFMGRFDSLLYGTESAFYKKEAKNLSRYAKNERFGLQFASAAALARTLSYKAELGVKTREAYLAGDKEKMKEILSEYDGAIRNIKDFIKKFRALWFSENCPQGFEVQEARLGGLSARLQSCRERLLLWMEEGVEIPELTEPVLDYMGRDELVSGHVRVPFYLHAFTSNIP